MEACNPLTGKLYLEGLHMTRGPKVVDAVERRAPPGTVFVLEPEVPEPHALTFDEWRAAFSNFHLAEPARVLLLARAAGALPERVLIVGCQPADCDRIGEGLSRPVSAAVDIATRRVCQLLTDRQDPDVV